MNANEIEMVVQNLRWEQVLSQTHKHMTRLANLLIRGCEVALTDKKQVQDFSDEVKKMQDELSTLTNATRQINTILKQVIVDYMAEKIGIEKTVVCEIVIPRLVERKNFKAISRKLCLPSVIVKSLYHDAMQKFEGAMENDEGGIASGMDNNEVAQASSNAPSCTSRRDKKSYSET